jgi:acyl carrier protein
MTDDIANFLVSWFRDWRPDLGYTELDRDTRLVEDLGVDSIALLELVANIESRFHIRIHDDAYRSRRTFGTLGGVTEVIVASLTRATSDT